MSAATRGNDAARTRPAHPNLLSLRSVLAFFVYHSASHVMYSMPVRTVWTFFTWPLITWPAYMLPSVASSQPGTIIGRFFSQAATIHEFFGSIW